MAFHDWAENPALAAIIAEIASARRIIPLLIDSHGQQTVAHYIRALSEEGRRAENLISDQS